MSKFDTTMLRLLDNILRCCTPTLALWEDTTTKHNKKMIQSSSLPHRVSEKVDDTDDEFARA